MIEVCKKIYTHVKVNLSSVHGIKAVDMLYCCILGDSVFGKGDKLSTESKDINGKLAFFSQDQSQRMLHGCGKRLARWM